MNILNMTTNITPEDIKLIVKTNTSVYIDTENLIQVLIKKLKIARYEAQAIINDIISMGGEDILKIKNNPYLMEQVKDFTRVLKVACRQRMTEIGLYENNQPFIDSSKYYNEKDIQASYTFHGKFNLERPGAPFITFNPVLKSLADKNLIDSAEIPYLTDDIMEKITEHENWGSVTISRSMADYNLKVRKIAVEIIEDLIIERWYTRYHETMKDRPTDFYITYDEATNTIDLPEESVITLAHLMNLMGYKINEIEPIIKNTIEQVSCYVGDYSSPSKEYMLNLMFINCIMMNSIENTATIEEYDVTHVCTLEFSQGEIESLFIDQLNQYMRPEGIIRLVKANNDDTDTAKIYDFALDVSSKVAGIVQKEYVNKLETYAKVYKQAIDYIESRVRALEFEVK